MKVNKGGKINVTFSKPTRVLIMTDREFKKYRENITFTYYGGHKESPYEFVVPKTDVWHIVVEKGSYNKPEAITASFSATHATKSAQHPRSLATSLDEADEQLDQQEEAVETDDETKED
jgi:hypothetical protein